ncbi:MAG: hypothetical protein CVV05_15500 [Gammaproteobacteria bacterium HGW-Gammaproteobacteria-1]|jgi:hypothetical protein|nr:MAG: hypothetical protein CVV05_15500 [Gammaproteobacteria bacterium HGW-Gammaproteobacteria-1]
MTTLAELKKRFERGDTPTGQDFADLIDAFLAADHSNWPEVLPASSAKNLTDVTLPDPLPPVDGSRLLNITPSLYYRPEEQPGYASPTALVAMGDQRDTYLPYMRLRLTLESGDVFPTVLSTSYDEENDATIINLADGVADNTLNEVAYSVIRPASAGGAVSLPLLGSVGEIKDALRLTSTTIHNFTSNANYALTPEQEEYARIVFTDTGALLTASRNVTISNTPRWFWCQNNTGQTIVVKTDGGNGIGVAAGTSRPLASDGTSVVDPATQITPKNINVPLNSNGNVSRLVSDIPGNGTSNGYWFKFATIKLNNQQYRDVSLSLRVIGEVNFGGAVDVDIHVRQDVATLSAQRSRIVVRNMTSSVTPWAPMFKAVAAANALGQDIDIWIRAIGLYQQYNIIEIAKGFVDTETVNYYSSGAWTITEPSGAFEVKSYSGSFGGRSLANVIDTSDLLTDTLLQPGEKAICSWKGQVSKALRIDSTTGGVFELTVTTNLSSDSTIYLNPNNTSYGGQILRSTIDLLGTALGGISNDLAAFLIQHGSSDGKSNYSRATFHVGSGRHGEKGGSVVSRATMAGVRNTRVTTFTWNNDVTPWTSLGTLVFGDSCSGSATIHRVS